MIREKKSIADKEIKKVIIFAIIAFIITVLTNIIAYSHLPEYVPIKSNGSNSLNKNLYALIFPSSIIVVNFINLKFNNRSILNSALINIIIPILNIWIIISAIK